jgi:hypothetical protein
VLQPLGFLARHPVDDHRFAASRRKKHRPDEIAGW